MADPKDTPQDKKEEDTINPSDIHNKTPEEIIKEGEDLKQKGEPEDKKVEDIKEPDDKKEEKKEEPTFDLSQIKSELKDEISQATAEKIVNALSGEDKSKSDKKDILSEAPWKKEGRNPTYEEALKYVATVAKEEAKREIMDELNKEVEDEEKQTKEKEEMSQKQQTEYNGKMAAEWDRDFKDLEEKGKIPAVKNKDDKNDPGIKARLNILTMMKEELPKAQEKSLPPIMSVSKIFYEYYDPANRSKANQKNAPVSGARRSVVGGQDDTFSAAEIHHSSIRDILEAGTQKS